MLPEAFVNSIVEKVVERIANPFSHIPATIDVPVATTSAAHSCPQSLSTIIVDNNASSPTNTFISGESNTPSLPSTIFTSPSLPINARVCDKIKSKILGNEFIDFGVLLSNPITEGKFQITMSSNKEAEHAMCLEPLTKTKKISMLKNWLSAFHVFCGVYTPISKNVVGENGEWQLSNGNCTTERNCGFHICKKTMSSSQPRRQQKPHRFAYLTMENSIFARFARAFFIF